MKLPKTEEYIAKGIEMRKLLNHGHSGLFSYSPPTYEYKTVYDLEEAIDLNSNGWFCENYQEVFGNLALMLWRDLRDKEDVEKKSDLQT